MADAAFDTNLLFYAYDPRVVDKHRIANRVVDTCFGKRGTLPLQVLAEFYQAASRKLLSVSRAAAIVELYLRGMKMVSASEHDLLYAMQLHQRHQLQFYDCMLLATLEHAGCATLLSEDMQHLARYGGVQVINPFLLTAPELEALLA